jgi:hypothetical protein
VWRLLSDARSQALVDAVERFAQGREVWQRVVELARAAPAGPVRGGPWINPNPVHLPPSSQAARAVLELTREDARDAALGVARAAGNLLGRQGSDVLREIIGNPFRSTTLDPRWLAWESATVVRLARGIDEDGAFERMPILADALEEAGCADTEILNHCRGLQRCQACLGAGKKKRFSAKVAEHAKVSATG